MRVLGVDFGTKRIGIAVGESQQRIASPRQPIFASGKLRLDSEAICEVARAEQAASIVVGIPENAGGDGRMARICLQLVEHIRRSGMPVETVDESLTSVEADRGMARAGLGGAARRKRSDGEAACRILERYWSESGPA